MELTVDQNFEKDDKQFVHCLKITVLPHEYEWKSLSFGYIVPK